MELVNVRSIGVVPDEQSYAPQDINLISKTFITPTFGTADDYVEHYIRDLNGDIIQLTYNSNYKPGTDVSPTAGTFTTVTVDPEQDVVGSGVDRGIVRIKYNFFRNLLSSNVARQFWIKEISPSRTEIKVARQDLSNTDLLTAFNALSSLLSTTNYYPDFLLNFGLDVQIIAVNAVYVEEDQNAYIIFKLYEPLPIDYDVKTQFWVVQKVADSVEYEVEIQVTQETVVDESRLRGPNFKINVNQRLGQTTPYYNYSTLLTTPFKATYQQLQSWLDDKGININVDYTDFANFIHFSSATERLLNFKYKVELIEAYQADILSLNGINNAPATIINTNADLLQSKIDNIIKKFDGYEYYLYFDTGSTSWPKQNDEPPYILYSATSSQVSNWLGGVEIIPTPLTASILYTASLYDMLNKDNLEYSMPTYIREDDVNQPYMTFLNMIGQHFDNIWLYYKDVSNRYSAENNPEVGISLDLVADALRGFGIALYTNTNVADNVYYSIFGLNETGSTLPVTSSAYAQVIPASSSLIPPIGNDYLSASIYLPPFGEEKINEYVTTLELLTQPPNKTEKEVYKRIYHNLPYLLKTKGTQRGIKALIACYGIPDSILTIHEFGANNILTAPIVGQIQDQKVFTGSVLHISSSLLTPFTTIQYYDNSTERGSYNVEVGFSPADSINADITGTLGNFNYMQYIGNPSLQYSSSYEPLVALANNYFDTNYTSRYNVWDFIRIIKYYNNSLFKMLKDFVPARASLSAGIIIKPHILERNKYARHEPLAARYEYSASIDTAFISGSDAPGIIRSTAYTSSVQTVSGSRTIDHIYDAEKYTGEFEGLIINAHRDSLQTENSNIIAPWTSSVQGAVRMYTTYSLDYLYQNVTSSVASRLFFDLDYAYNQTVPVNYGLVTASLNNIALAYTNPYAQWAYVQDYNYYLYRSTTPRYAGSKSTSLYYNTYTPPLLGYRTLTNLITASVAITSSYDWGLIQSSFAGQKYSTIKLVFDPPIDPTTFNLLYRDTFFRPLDHSDDDQFRLSEIGSSFLVDESKIYKVYKYYTEPSQLSVGYTGVYMAVSDNLNLGNVSPTISSSYWLPQKVTASLQVVDSWPGDSSYGNTAAIDRNSYKLGWVRTIPSQSQNFYEKTTINLKYLVDADLNVTELNYNNYNVVEVQNTFKSIDNVGVSVTDTRFPSSQITLDGTKKIFAGGFRYDPIIFRENNESLCFTFDNPISSSIEYVGVAARCDDYYAYDAVASQWTTAYTPRILSNAQAPNYGPGADYTITSDSVIEQPMASAYYIYNDWQALRGGAYGQNPKTNMSVYTNYNIDICGTYCRISRRAYEFNLINFTTTTKNNEPDPNVFTPNSREYIYKVPRDSSSYKIKAQVPFWFEGIDHGRGGGLLGDGAVGFKIVATVEKTNDPAAGNWQPVAVSTIEKVVSDGVVNDNPADNTIAWDGEASALYMCKLEESNITLAQGDYLRFRFYLLALTGIWRSEDDKWRAPQQFNFVIGGNYSIRRSRVNYPPDMRASISIEDLSTAYVKDYYNNCYSEGTSGLFFQQPPGIPNAIELSQGALQYIKSASIFTPSTSSLTSLYYTDVVDYFGIQPNDLFRAGPFEQRRPTYYTVQSSESINRAPLTVTGQILVIPLGLARLHFFIYSNTLNPTAQFQLGDVFDITSTLNATIGVTVRAINQSSTLTVLALTLNSPNATLVMDSGAINIRPYSARFRIYFTSDILPNTLLNAANFAILRPKPDETSVIIEHLKKPGIVSQTLLIPQDASTTLKDSVGDIFESLNVQLG